MRLKSLLFIPLCTALSIAPSTAQAQGTPFSSEARQKAEALLKQMTLDEKIGQLNQSAGLVLPGFADQKPDDLIAAGGVGSILWQMNAPEINRLQHIAVEKSRLHIPILFGFDVIHGYRTVFPVPLAMASSWDPSVEEQAATSCRSRMRARPESSGHLRRWSTSRATPVGDVSWRVRAKIPTSAPRWRARRFAASRVIVLGPQSVLACVKHFAGYGAAEGGRDYDSSYVPEELLATSTSCHFTRRKRPVRAA